MICPHCGPNGHVEQIGFGSEYETFFCTVCKNKYIAYALGNGEMSELVPDPYAASHGLHPDNHSVGDKPSTH